MLGLDGYETRPHTNNFRGRGRPRHTGRLQSTHGAGMGKQGGRAAARGRFFEKLREANGAHSGTDCPPAEAPGTGAFTAADFAAVAGGLQSSAPPDVGDGAH